ncbi:MAG TPA: hypothetical protein VGM67_18415 [Gemmatimonadaceae bacterium]|jgi:hypothetical protein
MKPLIRLSGVLAALSLIAVASAAPLRATEHVSEPAAAPVAPVAPVPCRPWSFDAEAFRVYITGLDTSTVDSASTYRTFWTIPVVDPTAIALVTDNSLCDQAARIHAASTKRDSIAPYPVFVLRVGPTRYIVFNFMAVGEWYDYTILDSSLKVLAVRRS